MIRGTSGEVITIAEDGSVNLAIEDEAGVRFDVGTVKLPEISRIDEEIAKKQDALTALGIELESNADKIGTVGAVQDGVENIDPATLGSDEARAETYQTLLASVPELREELPAIEKTEDAEGFMAIIQRFLKGFIQMLTGRNQELEKEVPKLETEVDELEVQAETQRRLAAERLRERKERIVAAQAFYQKLGVSPAIEKIKDAFGRISESSPVYLPDGTVITKIDLATLEIRSNRFPGAGGPNDQRSQQLFAELFNEALS